MRIDEFAPAKVNLTLEVLGRRGNGFHELRSLVAFARDCGDRLALEVGSAASVSVDGPFAAAIAGGNLIDTTLAKLAAVEPRLLLGRVLLDKRLPVAAGIGGGSADAAALLRAVRRANPQWAHRVDWPALAAALGSDVTICLESEAHIMEGVGERLTQARLPEQLSAVLVNPMTAVPADKTRRVFHALGLAPGTIAEMAASPPSTFATAAELLAYMRATGNALTEPASRVLPAIADVRNALQGDARCLLAQLSGAGPTCFGIYSDMDEARRAAATLAGHHPAWWVCPTLLG